MRRGKGGQRDDERESVRNGGRRKGEVKKGEGRERWYRPASGVNHEPQTQ